jgi:uncharacterized PurR-regulated membrane protein YhhQ (DUF165 family)
MPVQRQVIEIGWESARCDRWHAARVNNVRTHWLSSVIYDGDAQSHRALDPIMSSLPPDRWLSPRRQTEYPTRDLVAEETLHGRREATFLVLAAIVLVTTSFATVLGTGRMIALSPVLAAIVPDLDVPLALQLPFGVLPFALGALAVALVCELYGRRRAVALVAVSVVATLALAGLMSAADWLDGRDGAFGPALGIATCCLAGHGTYLLVFDGLRRRMAGRGVWLRLVLAALAAQLVGWTAFGLATDGYARLIGPSDPATITAVAAGAALYTFACVVVLALPIAVVAHVLMLFLRVARHDEPDDDHRDGPTGRRLPPAVIVEGNVEGNDALEAPPARRRAPRASIQPYSSAELQFFSEGDQLAESGAES